MTLYFLNFLNFFSKISILRIVIFCVILNLAVTWLFFFILFPDTQGFKFSSISEELFSVLIISPVIETYFIQHLTITLLRKYVKNDLINLIVSAILFALIHNYSVGYMIKGFIAGLIYATEYLIIEKKNKHPIYWVIATHALFNLIASGLDFFLS